jgi:hypothetical protein
MSESGEDHAAKLGSLRKTLRTAPEAKAPAKTANLGEMIKV